MLTKLNDTISFRQLPLLSALFIAVGMPLLHPALHSNSIDQRIISEYCDQHISAFADEDHELNCPICEFLATSQLYDTGIESIIAENHLADEIILIKNIYSVKIHPLQIEPRAPPISNSL